MDVFISYAKEDSQSASRLYHALLAVPGVVPWLDSKRLLPGAKWKVAIMSALKSCDLVIVLLSRNSVSKNGFVQQEIAEALDMLKQFPPDRIFLIPARLDECRPQHPELEEIQWVDLFPEWDSGLALIVQAIQNQTGVFVTPPTPQADTLVETITSAESFTRRLQARGEMTGCDAMELSFSGENFRGLNFAGASFVRCHFLRCELQNCNLKGVNFEGAVFKDCHFANADLWGANFWGANITGIVDFDQTRLHLTNFFGTRSSNKQKTFLKAKANIVELGDYGSFIRYFSDKVQMDEETIARTFVWLNHRYFRMMFGKDTAPFRFTLDLSREHEKDS